MTPPPRPTADDLWQTALFLPGPSRTPPGHDGPQRPGPFTVSARLAYQLLLHGRAVLLEESTCATAPRVDPTLPRAQDPTAPPDPAGLLVIALTASAQAAAVLDGGIEAWARAGLPVALQAG